MTPDINTIAEPGGLGVASHTFKDITSTRRRADAGTLTL
jgi:hypothetical protein